MSTVLGFAPVSRPPSKLESAVASTIRAAEDAEHTANMQRYRQFLTMGDAELTTPATLKALRKTLDALGLAISDFEADRAAIARAGGIEKQINGLAADLPRLAQEDAAALEKFKQVESEFQKARDAGVVAQGRHRAARGAHNDSALELAALKRRNPRVFT